jgi:DNA-binding NtrC family response regulator
MRIGNKAPDQSMIQVVNVIKLYLQGKGLNVFGFTDPLLALEHFRINCKNYMLIFSDIRMPGMNGSESKYSPSTIKNKVILYYSSICYVSQVYILTSDTMLIS